ncbi:MAG TPA: hypothetical protein VHO29_19610 [Marmoricola sp.]|nr:hypothetical protein [Marmoricola sp.]
MTPPSRACLRSLGPALLLATTVALGGCGSDGPTAGPTHATPSASKTAGSTPTDATSPTAAVQVIKVSKYGISFELPKGWLTLDAKKALSGSGNNPFLKELADRLGTTPQQLVQSFSTAVQTMSVSDQGAQHGFLENVNTVGQDAVLDDEAIKLQLATIGAKPGPFRHASSPAGDVTRVAYELPTKTGITVRAEMVAVAVDGATVFITVSSSSAPSAAKLADQVQASLKSIARNDPAA